MLKPQNKPKNTFKSRVSKHKVPLAILSTLLLVAGITLGSLATAGIFSKSGDTASPTQEQVDIETDPIIPPIVDFGNLKPQITSDTTDNTNMANLTPQMQDSPQTQPQDSTADITSLDAPMDVDAENQSPDEPENENEDVLSSSESENGVAQIDVVLDDWLQEFENMEFSDENEKAKSAVVPETAVPPPVVHDHKQNSPDEPAPVAIVSSATSDEPESDVTRTIVLPPRGEEAPVPLAENMDKASTKTKPKKAKMPSVFDRLNQPHEKYPSSYSRTTGARVNAHSSRTPVASAFTKEELEAFSALLHADIHPTRKSAQKRHTETVQRPTKKKPASSVTPVRKKSTQKRKPNTSRTKATGFRPRKKVHFQQELEEIQLNFPVRNAYKVSPVPVVTFGAAPTAVDVDALPENDAVSYSSPELEQELPALLEPIDAQPRRLEWMQPNPEASEAVVASGQTEFSPPAPKLKSQLAAASEDLTPPAVAEDIENTQSSVDVANSVSLSKLKLKELLLKYAKKFKRSQLAKDVALVSAGLPPVSAMKGICKLGKLQCEMMRDLVKQKRSAEDIETSSTA